MATKFFTCTLACMYRKEDETGKLQGGPMYFIEVGLGSSWRPLSVFFSCCGLIGCLAMFQSNQLAEIVQFNNEVSPWVTGLASATIVGIIIAGGLQRIAQVSERLIPLMCGIYIAGCLYIVICNIGELPGVIATIVKEAFTGRSAAGGFSGVAVSQVIATGVKRAAFSNEAGIGTAPMAHGAAKTDEPVREGLVAMLGPFIDTILVCSMTAFVILTSNVPLTTSAPTEGVALTSQAFEAELGAGGQLLVTCCVALFALTTMIGYSYYGRKCLSYLVGQRWGVLYNYFFVATLLFGAVRPVDTIINILDTAFAMMAIPTMLATLLLAPRVLAAARTYFTKYKLL